MVIPGISPDVARLLVEGINSVTELELLLLLRREAGRVWTPETVARTLYIDVTVAAEMLQRLTVRGCVARRGAAFQYGPAPSAVRKLVTELERAYSTHRVTVISLIYDAAARR